VYKSHVERLFVLQNSLIARRIARLLFRQIRCQDSLLRQLPADQLHFVSPLAVVVWEMRRVTCSRQNWL